MEEAQVLVLGIKILLQTPIPQGKLTEGAALIAGPGSALPAWGRMKGTWWLDNTHKLQFVTLKSTI